MAQLKSSLGSHWKKKGLKECLIRLQVILLSSSGKPLVSRLSLEHGRAGPRFCDPQVCFLSDSKFHLGTFSSNSRPSSQSVPGNTWSDRNGNASEPDISHIKRQIPSKSRCPVSKSWTAINFGWSREYSPCSHGDRPRAVFCGTARSEMDVIQPPLNIPSERQKPNTFAQLNNIDIHDHHILCTQRNHRI
jgi:hypothetical protein